MVDEKEIKKAVASIIAPLGKIPPEKDW